MREREKERHKVHERMKRTRWKSIFSALDPALSISDLLFSLSDHHGSVQPLLKELCFHGEEL